MGKRKHQHRKENNPSSEPKPKIDGVSIHQEPDDGTNNIPDAWDANFIQDDKSFKQLQPSASLDVLDIGRKLAHNTLEAMQKKSDKKHKHPRVVITPSPIQRIMWPILLDSLSSLKSNKTKSRNVIGIAQTGSGKTLSYCIPVVSLCICKLLSPALDRGNLLVHGIILCPTRELAIQVSAEMKMVVKVANKMLKADVTRSDVKIESVAIYGGVDIQSQMALLGLSNGDAETINKQPSRSLVVAATPGRLLDILNQNETKETKQRPSEIFKQVSIVVFDEADRMALNAEMSSQIDQVLDILKSDNRGFVRCLVSATLPQKSKEVIDKWVPCDRVVVKIDSVKVGDDQPNNNQNESQSSTNKKSNETNELATQNADKTKQNLSNLDLATIPSNLVQTLHVCANHKKPKKLITTLQRIYRGSARGGNKLCIVFFAQIKTLKFVCSLLRKEGFKCVELFGTLKQEEREQRLLSFKAGKFPILLASDLASRGIHIPNVHYVVNYDFPGSLDQYVHRCGRAGRNQINKSESATISTPPTVYSFFTREFAPMADSVIELLRICKAQIDPNLLALSSEKATDVSGSKSNKRRKKKRESKEECKVDEVDSDEEQFSHLDSGRIVLKRALHVSDAEDSDD